MDGLEITDPHEAIRLLVRRDGTYDFRYGAGVSRAVFVGILRGIAEQVAMGVDQAEAGGEW